ncbi:MAG TPA: hypothetical protein VFB66_15995 [Tepidisphaeraceae bacterium]|nr:hypothetical protein [Tepidisphaeraceae bacterium]
MEQTPDPSPVPALPYAPDHVPERRRGYRLIVALTVLNSLMFLGYFLGPPAWRYGRKRIDDRQKAAQARLQLQQARQTARVAAQKQLADTVLADARLAAERKQRREALERDLKACREHLACGSTSSTRRPSPAIAGTRRPASPRSRSTCWTRAARSASCSPTWPTRRQTGFTGRSATNTSVTCGTSDLSRRAIPAIIEPP